MVKDTWEKNIVFNGRYLMIFDSLIRFDQGQKKVEQDILFLLWNISTPVSKDIPVYSIVKDEFLGFNVGN